MNLPLRIPAITVAALVTGSAASVDAAADDLDVSANTPEVTISTRRAGKNFTRLPELEYGFVVEASCRDGLAPASLSLSIADTRVSMSADDVSTGAAIEIAVTVPAAQIGPVAVDSFCVGESAEQGPGTERSVRVSSVLSAQAALLCAGETTSEMTYASQSLDVMLHCEQPQEPETDPTS